MEAHGFYFELLGAPGPQIKNRLLFYWIFQTRRSRLMDKTSPRTGMEANGFYFELLGARGPQNKNPFVVLLDFPNPPPQIYGKNHTPDRNGGKRLLF